MWCLRGTYLHFTEPLIFAQIGVGTFFFFFFREREREMVKRVPERTKVFAPFKLPVSAPVNGQVTYNYYFGPQFVTKYEVFCILIKFE